ncbi:hypothetical protein GH714_034208 [Hevea brasiliensis]|uniref:SWIM-type domain-containing protein n=1 Tax=Hevea brasiliensis TaxID=3981 RepID=A0A6A6NDJ1_HEVBR|nr:hypothetical protein GH714_038738 [Hevea brasiliensis]KAF2323215.1 hypothetical protein GH714_034208 [Hevea brasiliensis]
MNTLEREMMGFAAMELISMEEVSQNSDQLLEEEGDDLEFDSNNLDIEGNGLEIEGNGLEIEGSGLEIEDNGIEIESHDLETKDDGVENNCDQMLDIEDHGHDNNTDSTLLVDGQNSESQGNSYPPPVVGMEFESYDDAYNYYNCYAKELGFAIRVKSSWTKRNSKEKRGAVLCCNCEGFKTMKEANSRRKETRTGCLAMIRLRLVESNRWRVDEVKLEHNHSFDPERAQNSKSHKKMDAGSKRKVEPTLDVEVRTIKLYRTAAVDPLDETFETYIWLFRAWLTCMFGRPPQTIITKHCKVMQSAIAEVFPRAHHRLCLSHVVQRVLENLGALQDYEAFQMVFNTTIYDTLKVDEFEMAWEAMNQRFGIANHEWLRSLYEDRERWAPAYSKDTFFAGMSTFQRDSCQWVSSYIMIKEREAEENLSNVRNLEVLYDKSGAEVRCNCGCFNFKGYLCRHALCILHYNGVEEIPYQYILARWRKDFKRLYVPDLGSNNVDIANPVQWFDHLYKRAMQVVEEGMISQDHYMVAWQAFKESLNKELDLLNEGANVYKLIGPVLVKQDLAEANANVRKRIDYISAELKRLDATLQDLEEKQNSKKDAQSHISLFCPYLYRWEVSLNTEPIGDDEADEFEIEEDCAMTEYVGQTGTIQGENPIPPAVGMEFESYEDVYYFYNCYAKEQGFGVRVSNTWYRKSKERYRGKLSCSSAGFKKKSEANRPRPETRTGCPAMIKFRLMENKRWRIIEVELEHNHLISPASGKFYKSHKLIGAGTKRTLQLDGPDEVQKIRMYRTVIIDSEGNEGVDDEGQCGNLLHSNKLKLREGDAQAVQDFFCRSQLMDPNFFYVVDLNEKGYMRNLFWADARSRVAYGYFGDVVAIDTTCLKEKFEVPLVSFIGVNHHGHSMPLGCGLLAGETTETYVWLLRAWLTCMLGRPPQAVITDQCRSLQTAVLDVLPRASHCLHLSHIMQRVPENLGDLFEFEAIREALSRIVNYFLRPEEFEAAWEGMVQHHGIRDHRWIQTLYEDRKRWVPAYVKETFLAGLFPFQQNEIVPSIFEGYLDKHTPLKEFLDKYDQALQTNHQLEALADVDSRNSS